MAGRTAGLAVHATLPPYTATAAAAISLTATTIDCRIFRYAAAIADAAASTFSLPSRAVSKPTRINTIRQTLYTHTLTSAAVAIGLLQTLQ
jgi:hypothetical protein